MFHRAAERFHRRFIRVLAKDNSVRVAHRHGCERNLLRTDRQRLRRRDLCLTHVDLNGANSAARYVQIKRFDAGTNKDKKWVKRAVREGEITSFIISNSSFDRQPRFVGVALVIHILADTADPVAAHHRFAAVGIEDAHFEIGDLRRRNVDHAVGAHAEMAV